MHDAFMEPGIGQLCAEFAGFASSIYSPVLVAAPEANFLAAV